MNEFEKDKIYNQLEKYFTTTKFEIFNDESLSFEEITKLETKDIRQYFFRQTEKLFDRVKQLNQRSKTLIPALWVSLGVNACLVLLIIVLLLTK